jgi:hypothetical protein
MTISVDYIKKNFDYDPVTGLILNKLTGRQVGYLESSGGKAYMKVDIRVGGKINKVPSARMAHVLMTGQYPDIGLVATYVNDDPSDLSWTNLLFKEKAVVSREAERQVKPSYVPTNDPNVFRRASPDALARYGEHNGVYVVRRWEMDSRGRQVGQSTVALLRFDSFEDACCAAEKWRSEVSA